METRNRRWILWGLLVLGAVFLSGCGARLDSVLQINPDGSGERTITATVSADDQEQYLKGNAAQLDEMFTSSTPEQLEYLGMSDAAEGAKVYSFKMTFANLEEYTDKVTRLLAAGGNRNPVEIEMQIDDSVFRKGLTYVDNVNNVGLMNWAAQAVHDSDVLGEQKENVSVNDLSEEGRTHVRLGEKEYDPYYGAARIQEVDDLGATSVQVATTGAETGEFHRTITYELPREHYIVDEAGFDEFFSSVTPEDGTLTPAGSTGTTWVLDFTSDDPADIVSWTNAALMSEETQFAVESRPAEGEGQLARELRVVDYFDCAAVCHRNGVVSGTIELPEPWYQRGGSSPSTEPITYVKPVQATSVAARVTVAESNPSLTMTYAFEAADVAGLEDAAARALSLSDTSDVTLSDEDGRTVFTVEYEAENPQAYTSHLGERFGALRMDVQEVGSTLFQRRTMSEVSFTAPGYDLIGGPVDLTIEFAGLGEIDQQSSSLPPGATVDGNVVTLTASGVAVSTCSCWPSGRSGSASRWWRA
ncbi:MAG: hypothetical protein GXX86_11820 [Propionibacterium sp.]|nr:hypothetical protein [Propionibacterium sp.]